MKILVVGAGFSGAVIAHQLAKAGHDIVVIDERDHIGGNAYDYKNDKGIRVHKYGPHLFHTNNKKVYDWITQFDEWVPYRHKVKAQLHDGTYVTLPVNKETKRLVVENMASSLPLNTNRSLSIIICLPIYKSSCVNFLAMTYEYLEGWVNANT